MATYKVIQDIESEDKLLGPLTLKGFIYAIIAIFCAFINFRLLVAGLGPIKYLLVLVFAMPMILFGVLASPLGRQQPTEVWLLARIRFLLKPRKRLWSQTGILHLVTITAPKKIEKQRTKGLSEEEVRSRLQTLSSTLDSRGWAVKNLTVAPDLANTGAGSDRLVAPTTITPHQPSGIDITPADDIMDEQSNPTAQYLSGLIAESDAGRKAGVAQQLNVARSAVDTAEASAPAKTDTTHAENPMTPNQKLDAPQSDYRLLRSGFGTGQADDKRMTATERADKLELAQSGSDFSVATLSKLANRNGQFRQIGPNEGLLKLH